MAVTKQKVTGVIGAILIVCSVVFGVLAAWHYFDEQHAGDEYQDIAELAASPAASPSDGGDANVENDANYTSPIDFAALQEACPDAYAWIRAEGTGIDFPIVQAEGDQSYYLTHSAQKRSNIAGAIFTQNLNSKDFTDPVTVVYGHNLTNGKMFSCLHDWSDRSFFDAHRELQVFLPERTLTYQVFVAYATDDENILLKYDFNDPGAFERYLQEVRSNKSMSANVTNDVRLDSSCNILVLSTCNDDHTGRFVVQAVLVP